MLALSTAIGAGGLVLAGAVFEEVGELLVAVALAVVARDERAW